jgi:hypothetical protein
MAKMRPTVVSFYRYILAKLCAPGQPVTQHHTVPGFQVQYSTFTSILVLEYSTVLYVLYMYCTVQYQCTVNVGKVRI